MIAQFQVVSVNARFTLLRQLGGRHLHGRHLDGGQLGGGHLGGGLKSHQMKNLKKNYCCCFQTRNYSAHQDGQGNESGE